MVPVLEMQIPVYYVVYVSSVLDWGMTAIDGVDMVMLLHQQDHI